jgi:glycosyltransferase involved in cell wall biosynthesis
VVDEETIIMQELNLGPGIKVVNRDRLVTIVTATTGNPLLQNNIKSVLGQTYNRIQHLVVVDGPDHKSKVDEALKGNWNSNLDVIYLPYSTGKDRFNGHRIYGAATYLADGDFIMFLDDDNSIEPTHVADCIKVIQSGNDWAYSFRNIVDKDSSFICQDNCESLGKWPSIISDSDFFIDVNCYFLPKNIALAMSPVWYRKFREPGQLEIDRAMFAVLTQRISSKYDCTMKYTVNYAVGNSHLSVQKEFFIQGNEKMLEKHEGILPWVK